MLSASLFYLNKTLVTLSAKLKYKLNFISHTSVRLLIRYLLLEKKRDFSTMYVKVFSYQVSKFVQLSKTCT